MTLENIEIAISVVIAMKNEEKSIQNCLNSFLNQTISKENYEIIIVDGMSEDKSVQVVRQFIDENTDINIRLLLNPKRLQASGWNIGFKHSNAQYVVMMGAHTIAAADFLEKNLLVHREFDCPCSGGLVRAIGVDKKSKSIAAAFNSSFGAGNAKYWHGSNIERVETVAFGMYKKEVIDEVGPIDENIIRGQDWEFNYRIVERFGKMVFSPDIKSFYTSRNSFTRLWKRQFQAGMWKVFIIKKHIKSLLMRHVIPFLFALSIIISLILLCFNMYLPLIIVLVVYGFFNIFNAIKNKIVLHEKDISILYMSISYFIIHFAYGLGGILGIQKFILKKINK